MKKLILAFSIVFAASLFSEAYAKMIAFTVNKTEVEAEQLHKKEGASTVDISCDDPNYQKVVRARYKDLSGTFLVTDAIAKGDTIISRQTIVSKTPDLVRGICTFFNKNADYEEVTENKWKTVVDGKTLVIYLTPVPAYGEALMIENERFK